MLKYYSYALFFFPLAAASSMGPLGIDIPFEYFAGS